MSSEANLPIREVARITGVNPVTLRAWQRRYGLINPERTASGHRLYSELDIAQIRQILHWLEQGVAISQVKPLLARPDQAVAGSNWEQAQHELSEYAFALNLGGLEHRLRELAQLYPAELLLRHVIEPWLQQLGMLERPDRALLEQAVQSLLMRLFSQLLCIQKGPRIAVVRIGTVDPLAAVLLQYELQGLECRSHNLGVLDPKQLPLAAARLQADAYLLLPGSGLTAAWLRERRDCWPEHSFAVGPLGHSYQQQGWLNLPHAASVSVLARDNHEFFSLVQKRSEARG